MIVPHVNDVKNWLLHPIRSWHRRQERRWEFLYLEARGKRTEIERGRDGFMWRIAVVNEHECRRMVEHHREKAA